MASIFFGEETTEVKKDRYRAYLKDTGIIDKLSEIFNKMTKANAKHENVNPLNFIRKELGAEIVEEETIESLENDLEDAQREIQRLRNIMKKLGLEDEYEEEGSSMDCTFHDANGEEHI